MKDNPPLPIPELSAEERRRIREAAPPFGGIDLAPDLKNLPNAKPAPNNPTIERLRGTENPPRARQDL